MKVTEASIRHEREAEAHINAASRRDSTTPESRSGAPDATSVEVTNEALAERLLQKDGNEYKRPFILSPLFIMTMLGFAFLMYLLSEILKTSP